MPLNNKPVRVLVLEKENEAGTQIRDSLERAGMTVVSRFVENGHELQNALMGCAADVVVSRLCPAQIETKIAIRVISEVCPSVPLIVSADCIDDKSAVNSIRAGAEDIVITRNSARLSESIVSALSVRERLKTLSPRQLEVLRFVALGSTTRSIAERLGISVKTVETHRTAMMRRLGVHDVASLVRYAVRVGFVSADD